jgi:hypothetical protein
MMDREMIIKGCEYWVNNHKGEDLLITYSSVVELLELLKEQKELVRCADCRHADISPSGLIKCRGIFRSRDWFCADGERKTNCSDIPNS